MDQQIEMSFWDSVKDTHSPAVLQTYLDRYPNGEFATIARALIQHYEQQAKAEQAARAEEQKRQEEARKAAEVKRLEDERRAKEEALAAERRRARETNDPQTARQLEEKFQAEAIARSEMLRKALDEVIAAERTIAAKRTTDAADPTKIAALPKLEVPKGAFDGVWTFRRSIEPSCGAQGSVFTVQIANGVVTGPGGRGSLVGDKIQVRGRANAFLRKVARQYG